MNKNNLLAILIIVILVVAGGALYFFYGNQPNAIADTAPTPQNQTNDVTVNPETPSQTFTADQLAQYNGQNGQPAYVAVDGLVYDFSPIFKNGNHREHIAGKDLTNEFNNQHNSNMLKRFKVVGTYIK